MFRSDAAPWPVLTIDDIVEQFLDGTLDPDAWTHPAHLFVCRHVLAASSDVAEATDRMRTLITGHNARAGVRPGHGGYHETITRYFVAALAYAAPVGDAALLVEPTLRRDAPLDHWSRDLLASDAARTGWVDPDLAPLPWTPTHTEETR